MKSYSDWSNSWERHKKYFGTKMREEEVPTRIDEVLSVWRQPLPAGWIRKDWSYIKAEGYRRGDKDHATSEHALELKLFAKNQWDLIGPSHFTAKFTPVLNAVSLANTSSKQRESDVLGFLTFASRKLPCVVEMKGERTNSAWFAVVELLQHIKLLHDHPVDFLPAVAPFDRISDLPFSTMVGMILAPRIFFTSPGQKENSFRHAKTLIDRIKQEIGVTILMAALGDGQIELLYGWL